MKNFDIKATYFLSMSFPSESIGTIFLFVEYLRQESGVNITDSPPLISISMGTLLSWLTTIRREAGPHVEST